MEATLENRITALSLALYINEHNVKYKVKSIVSWKVKDSDDELGAMGEELEVKCVGKYQEHMLMRRNPEKELTCLVNIAAFRKWRNKQPFLRWINE